MKLNDKVAIVTGAGAGLGRKIALKLAEEGAKLLIVARNLERLEQTKRKIQGKGVPAISAKVDVSVEQDTLEMVNIAIKEFGAIDILVNNAAIGFRSRRPFYEISPEEWDSVMATNIKGYWQCIKAVFPYMKKQGRAKIINIASNTFFLGSRGFAHYVATKGAIIGLSRAVASEVGSYGICVNVVAPGFIANEAGMALMGGDISKYDVEGHCIKRAGMPEDVVGVVVFLASGESDFITGQTIVIDGGRVMR